MTFDINTIADICRPHNEKLIAEGRAAKSERENDKLRTVILELLKAYDSGNLQMNSPEIGEPENDIPMHQWHEEWLHHARTAVGV